MTPPPFRRSPLLVLATALLAGCAKPPAPPETPPPAPVVWVAAPQVGPEEWTELVGVTQPLPNNVGRVTAPIDGRVEALLVVKDDKGKVVKELHEGDEVPPGGPVVYLDDRIARLNRDKAKSALDTAGQEVGQAETALNLAKDQLTSLQDLQKTNPALVPPIQMKTAQGGEQDARSKLAAAQQRQEQAAKELESLETQLQFYTLKAPIQGRLGRVKAAVGQTLTAGTEVAEIVNIDEWIDVLCFVSQRQAAHLQVNQPADMGGFDERPDEIRTSDAAGVVAYVSDKAEPESGCFVVKVRFPNHEPHLRGNVVQRIRVQTQPTADLQPCIPEAALIEDSAPPSVVIVENVKEQKNADGEMEETGTARRVRALLTIRDRDNKVAGFRGLEDADGKMVDVPKDQILFVTVGAAGLETGDSVRLQKKEKD